MHNIVIYGGTFDPVHNGHINTAINVQKQFHFEKFIFLPCKRPLLKKDALASEEQRVAMLRLALGEQNKSYHFTIDSAEIDRVSPSYMVHTLEDFRQFYGKEVSITLLLGADTFLQLPQWYEWQKILVLANLLVIERPGVNSFLSHREINTLPYHLEKLPSSLAQLLTTHWADNPKALLKSPHGLIYCFNAGNFPISSTWCRQQLQAGNLIKNYIPNAVMNYIKQYKLYIA